MAIFASFVDAQQERRSARSKAASAGENAKRPIEGIRQKLAPLYLEQVAARYRVAARTGEPFRERLMHFWTNHFAVSADKPQVIALAATLENEAIRPHLAGRFVDLLLAVESHPAMILYLDNQASIGPNSQLAQRAARRLRTQRKLDINENLAREILELHTLGVDGGYTQADVTSLRACADRLVGRHRGAGRSRKAGPEHFEFRERIHEPGAKIDSRQALCRRGHRTTARGAARSRPASGDRAARRDQARATLHLG